MYGYINSIVGTWQTLVQRESFIFLSLLVNQLELWIGCVFRGNQEVHSANKVLKQLRFAFLSYLSIFLQLRQIICKYNHCLRIEGFSFSDREKVFEMLSTGIVELQHAVACIYQTGGPRGKCGPRSLNFKPQPTYLFSKSSGLYPCIKVNDCLWYVITLSLFL